jgi:hypothetical protein
VQPYEIVVLTTCKSIEVVRVVVVGEKTCSLNHLVDYAVNIWKLFLGLYRQLHSMKFGFNHMQL